MEMMKENLLECWVVDVVSVGFERANSNESIILVVVVVIQVLLVVELCCVV